MIDQTLFAAIRTLLSAGFCAVGQIFLQCAFHTHFPRVDRLVVKFEAAHEFEHLLNGHTITEYARNEFGIVPEFWVEFLGKTFNGGFETTLVDELEVVAFHAVFIDSLDDFSFVHRLRAEDALIVIGDTSENLVGTVVDQSDKRNPFFLVVLETSASSSTGRLRMCSSSAM